MTQKDDGEQDSNSSQYPFAIPYGITSPLPCVNSLADSHSLVPADGEVT